MWKDIKNYEGLYQVSTDGCVRSLDRKIKTLRGNWFYKGKILKKNVGTNGYYYVVLSKNSRTKTAYIHKLVADTFLEKPNKEFVVDHINENKLDNRLVNLRYLSNFDNISRSSKGWDKYDKHLERNPKAKNVVGVKDNKVVEVIDCAKKMVYMYNINYSTLKQQLQNNHCIINDIEYYYEANFNKKMEQKELLHR